LGGFYLDNNKREISTLREYSVVKHNHLIQQSRHNLSTQEQKIILYLITKIKPEDTDLYLYDFLIKDFCEICGIDGTSGKNHADLKDTIKKMADKSIWIKLDNGKETLLRWIEKPYIDEKSGKIEIKLDKDMKPYLLELKQHFTTYSLYFTLAMKSKYSIRIYELLKSYQNMKQIEFEIEQLKQILSAEKYELFGDFKRKVLDISIREINELSDIFIKCEIEKKGRKFHKIKFLIKPKIKLDERLETFSKIEKRLNSKQFGVKK
jgi:plasmid replication initiation protein